MMFSPESLRIFGCSVESPAGTPLASPRRYRDDVDAHAR